MEILTTVLEYSFYGATAVQYVFWLFVFSRLAVFNQKTHLGLAESDDFPRSQQAVSVVICARNEAANLRQNLPTILEQDYPNFEVLVVNDASTDDSLDVLNELSKQYAHLKIVSILEIGRAHV